MADTPARAAWRALVARLTPEALREAAHLAVDAAFDAANDAALATWLKGRARSFALGAEGPVLDKVFAGYLVPTVSP